MILGFFLFFFGFFPKKCTGFVIYLSDFTADFYRFSMYRGLIGRF